MDIASLLPVGKIDTGDTAWMMTATALVLLMTLALGLFYAGLVRAKNTLNTFMMCVAGVAVAVVTWAVIGYSFAFDPGNGIIGGFDFAFLNGVGFEANPDGLGPTIPHIVFFAFQATFCIITTALVSGAVVERMRFGAYLIFAALWSILVYAVLAHWGFGFAEEGGGWLVSNGTLDFAGGIAVEMASGFSALAAALVVGARKDYGRQALLPHNAVYVLVGAGLLWFGWFGFNGGSGFNAGQNSQLALVNTLLTPACALVTWFALDLVRGRQVTAIGAATAIIVGCVLITPAGGFISPAWAMALGFVGAIPCWFAIQWRPRTRVDETLDVLAAHGIAGFFGILFIGLFAQVAWNGIADGAVYGNWEQLKDQVIALIAVPAYAFGMTFVLLKGLGALMPLRASEKEEALGMDVTYHGEEAYASGEGAILVSPEAGLEEPVPVADPG